MILCFARHVTHLEQQVCSLPAKARFELQIEGFSWMACRKLGQFLDFARVLPETFGDAPSSPAERCGCLQRHEAMSDLSDPATVIPSSCWNANAAIWYNAIMNPSTS